MADGLTVDLLEHSVTSADAGEYRGGGVVQFLIPWFMMGAANLPLPADLPPYWTLNLGIARYWSRDMILRSTILNEDFWAGAIGKFCSKAASKSFNLEGYGAARWQQMLLDWGGDGYVPSQERGVIDFSCTNNGEHWEIVRATQGYGARILGLVHLDSLRCIRTGDPQIPIVFSDLKGKYHELKDYQVFSIVDMPDPSSASLGIGHCSAERAYHQIYKLSAIEQYLREKVTGSGANTLDFLTGLNDKQIQNILATSKDTAEGKGSSYYQGHILTGILAQVKPELLSIKLRDLPDGFDREKEMEIAQLAYANAIGLDPQDLNPHLVGRGSMGIGAQSAILDEKQKGLGIAARDKQLTHMLNERVLPGRVTFALNERDLREEASKATTQLTREQWLNSKILNGQLSAQQALQISINSDDVPREMFPQTTALDNTSLADEDKPVEGDNTQPQDAVPTPAPQAQAQPPVAPAKPGQIGAKKPPVNQAAVVKEMRELRQSIDRARQALSE